MFSCKRWTSTKSGLTVETLLVLSRSYLWMIRRFHRIPRIYCYFYLEPMGSKDTWMRITSVTVMVVFSEKGILKVTWSQLCSKSLLNKYKADWQQHFQDTLQFFILRTWINMRAKSFVKTSVNVTETKIDEGALKKVVTQSVHLEEHCAKIETTFHLFYALLFLTNLVFKFYIVLIGNFSGNVNHNLLFCLFD